MLNTGQPLYHFQVSPSLSGGRYAMQPNVLRFAKGFRLHSRINPQVRPVLHQRSDRLDWYH